MRHTNDLPQFILPGAELDEEVKHSSMFFNVPSHLITHSSLTYSSEVSGAHNKYRMKGVFIYQEDFSVFRHICFQELIDQEHRRKK